MYETYVPIADTIVERKPPTIADIVREKTGNGAHIVDFFLDLMEGRVEDARLCHRIDAAKQLVKYGSKDAAEFIADHRDEPCDHCETRKRGPRPRKDAVPAAGPPYAAPHLTPDFLTLLTEDFFTVLTAVDEDLMIKLVRGQTRYGDSIVEFLDDVMQGRNDRFKPHHRIAAAKELISHILRDEHRPHTPSPVGAGFKPALPGAAWEPFNPESIVPAPMTVVPAKAGFLPQEPSPTQGGGGARVAVANSADFEPVWSTAEGPKIVRPEPVEGQCSGDSAVPGPAANEADLTVVPAEAGFLPQEPSPTQRVGAGRRSQPNSAHPEPVLSTKEEATEGSQLETKNSTLETLPARRNAQGSGHAKEGKDEKPTPPGQRIEEKPESHWHEPDPRDGPIDSTTPGRSPPW